MTDLSETSAGALLHVRAAGGSPFECNALPPDCEALPSFYPRLESLAAQLQFDTAVPGRLNTPTTLLSGFGESICVYRAGVQLLKDGAIGIMQPIKELTKQMMQGPSAIGNAAGRRLSTAPNCDPGDSYCLVKVSRSTRLYKFAIFPALYLHFWSLGSPPLVNPCEGKMEQRFTIPGLFSSFALQSSTFLAHTRDVVCARFTHLLAYAMVVQNEGGDCDPITPSLLVSVDAYGNINSVSELYLPPEQGSGAQP